jgi:hypothetical protein
MTTIAKGNYAYKNLVTREEIPVHKPSLDCALPPVL